MASTDEATFLQNVNCNDHGSIARNNNLSIIIVLNWVLYTQDVNDLDTIRKLIS